jgi:hypothetical protein
VLETHDLNVIISFKLQVNEVTIAGVLRLDLALNLCQELVGDDIIIADLDIGAEVLRVSCI